MDCRFLLVFLFACFASEEKYWIAIDRVSEDTGIALSRVLDVRSVSNLLLIVGTEREYSKLERAYPQASKIAKYNEEEEWVLVYNRNGTIDSHVSGAYRISESKLLIAINDENQNWIEKESIFLEREFIADRAIAVSKPIQSSAQDIELDPRIQSLVDSVSSQGLRDYIEKLTGFYTRYSRSQEIREAQAWLQQEFAAIGASSVETMKFRDDMSDNVIAKFDGVVEPDKIVIIGAHYDCIPSNGRAPGADDNASGTCSLLEQARAIAASGLKFRYSIWFMAFGGEEQGLLGSKYAANLYKQQGLNIVGMLNGDMLGYTIPNAVPHIGMKYQSITPSLREFCSKVVSQYIPNVPQGDSPGTGSDFRSFFEAGFPAFAFFESNTAAVQNPYYHKVTDTMETLNFAHYRDVSAAILSCGAALAQVA